VKPAGLNEKQNLPIDPSAALEQIMAQYGTAVLRTAYFYLGDRHLAEDVSQEVFLRAYRQWSNFRGDSSVKTWLTTITVNVCRDKMGVKSYSEQPAEPGLLERIHPVSAEEEAIERLNRTTVLKHVLALPGHYQEVLYLYYYLDLSTREIAEATGAPEGSVRGRMHRAREVLGKHLREEGFVYERF
jgi:RNA polymerase sigma-70 factor (ECF subfamily)